MTAFKKVLTALSFMLPVLFASAQVTPYSYLTIRTQDGAEQSFSLQPLKLIFENGNLLLRGSDKTTTVPLSTLASMRLTGKPTAISNLQAGQESVRRDGLTIMLSGIIGKNCTLYNASGVAVRVITLQNGSALCNLAGLPNGVYILKTATRAFKINL